MRQYSTCAFCEIRFENPFGQKYCSLKCSGLARRGTYSSKPPKEFICTYCRKAFKSKRQCSTRTPQFCSIRCSNRLQTDETRRKNSITQLGIKPDEWRGFTTPKNRKARASREYKEWRAAVFARDNHTCQFCGMRGVKLHADHTKPFAIFLDLRYDVDNGRTLCVPCHKKTDTYGAKTSRLRRAPFSESGAHYKAGGGLFDGELKPGRGGRRHPRSAFVHGDARSSEAQHLDDHQSADRRVSRETLLPKRIHVPDSLTFC